jgi:formate hydrogenlyase subunit 4
MAGIPLILLAAVFFPGIILRTKSISSGRKGPGMLQPMMDIRVLFQKGSVYSTTTGWIFRLAPLVGLAAILSVLAVVPFANMPALIPFQADFVFFSYMLALGKFFMIIGALDTGSSFEGMGANREALFSMLVEPAFLVLMGTFAMLTGYSSFSDMFTAFHLSENPIITVFGIIGFYLLVQIAMIENSRMPVDDPKTHLELTMVHEVMILDYSGFDKALIHITTAIKFAVYGSLICSSLVPSEWNPGVQIVLFFTVQAAFAIIIGIAESFRARKKMQKNAQFILTLTAVAMLAFLVVLIVTDKLIV